jgi:predicted AlkP superfamily pyrophosphatase or phosphodiesterase
MKHSSFLFLFLLLCFTVFAQKVVFVIADGIPADVLERVATPNIDAVAKKGTYMRTHVGGDSGRYNQTPTISANGYNSLLTGTWVNKHNVWDNDIAAPNYHYKTIFRLFKDQYPNKKIAVFSSWQDNRTKLIGEGLPETGNIKMDMYADGFELDTARYPHDKRRSFMHRIDDTVVNAAVKSIRTQAPDLSWVYLEYTDDIGHMYGDSKEQDTAVQYLDEQIGRLYKAIEYRQKNHKEDWMMVITTDHGRDAKSGHNHGGQSQRERTTWMVTNKPVNTYGKYDEPAIVDIYPSITNFLHFEIPTETKRELDGVPFVGKVSLAQPKLLFIQNKIDISWQALDTTGEVKIWIAPTNNFATGGKDEYKLMGTVPLALRHVTIDVANIPSTFYKVALEGEYNTVNRWLFVNDK